MDYECVCVSSRQCLCVTMSVCEALKLVSSGLSVSERACV